ncbi:hypothetical protein ACFSF0_11265 [Ottowia flava]|uniref:Uncharacterized protein n=1 Tax=Ottowia flava TaxID=2675430 RepID=A0ABW4KWN8_9BURK|nr:hypothetical protein [Ottowia sp. GY511]
MGQSRERLAARLIGFFAGTHRPPASPAVPVLSPATVLPRLPTGRWEHHGAFRQHERPS